METKTKRPYRIITVYSNEDKYRDKLNAIGAVFTERQVHSGFWGTEFTIEKPKGKGAYDKMRAIDNL